MFNFQLGQSATLKRTFTAADLAAYATLTGAHQAASQQIVPGPLLGGMFSNLLGTTLPGRGTNYLKQRLEFPKPALLGQELTARVEITRLRPEKFLVTLDTVCTNAAGEIVCRGAALVLVKDVELENS
ncbi:MAG: MaoC family dehydratase [Chloroflexi bacterium]|nr:MaoC family dehydratase [Chloroflexota bacterium]